MSELAKRLKNELAQLSSEEREEIAYFLLDSLEIDDRNLEAELSRRLTDFESGKSVGVPADEVFERLRKKRP